MTNPQALKAAARALWNERGGDWAAITDRQAAACEYEAQVAITVYLAALPPLTPELEAMRERLNAMYSHRGDGIPTQYVNPDGPDAWALIERLARPPITEGIVEDVARAIAGADSHIPFDELYRQSKARYRRIAEAAIASFSPTIQRLTHELSVARGEKG